MVQHMSVLGMSTATIRLEKLAAAACGVKHGLDAATFHSLRTSEEEE